MAFPIHLNRRSGFDRRLYDMSPSENHRKQDRRDPKSNSYVLIMGGYGFDRFTVLIAMPLAALLAMMVLGS